jgi:hypothetical protein
MSQSAEHPKRQLPEPHVFVVAGGTCSGKGECASLLEKRFVEKYGGNADTVDLLPVRTPQRRLHHREEVEAHQFLRRSPAKPPEGSRAS